MNKTMTQLPAQLLNFASKVGGSYKLVFETNENVPHELLSRIIKSNGQTGWLAFLVSSEEAPAIRPEDIDIDSALPKPESKSLSQQLRDQMYHYWRAKNPDEDPKKFEEYRKNLMETLIEKYKAAAWEAKEAQD